MLKSDYYTPPTELDHHIFETLIPPSHYVRQVKAVIDFDVVRAHIHDCYSETMGRTAMNPVLMFKLEYLQFHYNLSDREVITQAQVNVAYRYFLDLSLTSPLPVPSLLRQFRRRIGVERHQQLFDGMVAQGRSDGLVKDRLRVKDATHVIANIAIPSTIQLVAQVRERLLRRLKPYAPQQVAVAQAEAARLRQVTSDLKDEERLVQRVTHLRHIVAWAEEVQRDLVVGDETDTPQYVRLETALTTAHKL